MSKPKGLHITINEADRAVVQAAAQVLLSAALNVIQGDPHRWSERPCSSCRAVTSLLGTNFGCYLYAAQEAERLAHKKAEEAAKLRAVALSPAKCDESGAP